MKTADSPEVVIAKRLLDHAKQDGFTFQRAGAATTGRWWDAESAMAGWT